MGRSVAGHRCVSWMARLDSVERLAGDEMEDEGHTGSVASGTYWSDAMIELVLGY